MEFQFDNTATDYSSEKSVVTTVPVQFSGDGYNIPVASTDPLDTVVKQLISISQQSEDGGNQPEVISSDQSNEEVPESLKKQFMCDT